MAVKKVRIPSGTYDINDARISGVDSTVTAGSGNVVTSGAVATALAAVSEALDDKQDTLVSGTNIKTVNGTSLLGSGNIDAEDIFWATYGTTTFEELTAAWNDGKQILCHWSNRVYNLIYIGASFTFGYVWGTTTYRLACSASSVWSNTSDSNQSQITVTGLLKGNGSGSVTAAVAGTDYQEVLVSGTNIKTINNESLLGSGNITIQGGGGPTPTTYQLGDELYFRIAAPASTNDRCVLQVIAHYVGPDEDQISHGTPIMHIIELGFTEEPIYYFYMFGSRLDSAFGNNILYSYNDTTYENIAYYIPTLGANSYAEVTVLSGTAPSISVVNGPVSGETVDWDNPIDWIAMRGGVTSIYYWSSGLRVNYSNGTYEYIYSATLGQGYGTNAQSASTTARTVALANYEKNTGGIVAVRFTNAVPANATLNIDSKGATNIYYRGSRLVANVIEAGDTVTFMYDGSNYQIISIDKTGGGGSSDAVLYTAQTLTTSQQTQARTNIAAVGYNVTSTGTPVVLGLEQTTNKVTSLSASSTDTQYPSAKCVYDYIDDTVGDIATLLAAI